MNVLLFLSGLISFGTILSSQHIHSLARIHSAFLLFSLYFPAIRSGSVIAQFSKHRSATIVLGILSTSFVSHEESLNEKERGRAPIEA